ncbi:MAG TPA: porin family protein [Woeseiaceae bacterium]|nr:porin family protein [Woeseiaceae bacterium]
MNRTTTLAATVMLATAMPLTAQAHPDAYVGASIGNARLDDDFDGFGIDTDTNAYRFFGGIQLGETFGIEAGYLNFGDFTETVDLSGLLSRTDISGDGWTLGGTLSLPLSNNLSIFGKGGVFFWDADITIDGFSIDTPGDDNPYWGGGLKLDLGDNFSLVGDWTVYEFDVLETDVISIGFNYRF